MMPMRMRRKTHELEKVENLYRTAPAGKILSRRNTSDHARAIPWTLEAKPARSSIARRSVKA